MHIQQLMMLSAVILVAPHAMSDEVAKTCQAAGWDMNREIAAFGGAATSVAAGTTVKDAKNVKVGLLAELSLKPQSDVHFAMPPERLAKPPMPFAGLAQLDVPTTGNYRITVNMPLWLDAVSAGTILPSGTFNGWHECSLFRKTVEYRFQVGQTVVLQLSGAATELVKVLIEPVETAR